LADYGTNVWTDELGPGEDGIRGERMYRPPGATLAVALWELDPGEKVEYHFHHGNEETIVVLRGRPTLRTPEGERELEAGEFLHFPKGPAGAHQMVNRSDEPVRYLVGSSNVAPEICEYPDSGKVAVFSRLESQRGQRLVTIHRLDDGVDYFDGEEPKAS
jgi:uncharacterized cupin superfamily protein